MVDIDVFDAIRDCVYKDEHYSVRDNGAILRHSREDKRRRKLDNIWTWGIPNDNNGYMTWGSEKVHRIVATAFHGKAPGDNYVVDHIDTNRRNNRPENLRWVTRLENVLKNPITRARIENICGSIEAFLEDPSLLSGHEDNDSNFHWMRTVTKEEARITLDNLMKRVNGDIESRGGSLSEWIFHENNSSYPYNSNPNVAPPVPVKTTNEIQSLTPNAVQIDWRIPSEFPCCPVEPTDKPLETYKSNLIVDAAFSKNDIYSSIVVDSTIVDGGKSLWVMTRSGSQSVKPWALTMVVFEDGVYKHISIKTFFEENGARKIFTLAQGKDWEGEDSIDDYC